MSATTNEVIYIDRQQATAAVPTNPWQDLPIPPLDKPEAILPALQLAGRKITITQTD